MTTASPSNHWHALRRAPLAQDVWLALTRHYAERGLPWQAGYAARQAYRLAPASVAELNTLALGPWQDPAAGDGQLGRAALPNAVALSERFAAIVTDDPDDWLTWLYLARLYDIAGRAPDHDQALQRARALEIIPGETRHWLGVWRLAAGDAPGAVAALAPLIDLPTQRTLRTHRSQRRPCRRMR